MKKIYLCAIAALALVAATSCSNKEDGVNAANDESAVGATDGMVVVEESASEIAPEIQEGELVEAPDATTDVTVEDVTAPTAAEQAVANARQAVNDTKAAASNAKTAATEKANEAEKEGKSLIQKVEDGTVNTYNKAKDGTVKTYNKVKDGTKNAYEKAKDGTVKAYDKTKEGVKNAYEKVKEEL